MYTLFIKVLVGRNNTCYMMFLVDIWNLYTLPCIKDTYNYQIESQRQVNKKVDQKQYINFLLLFSQDRF